MGQLILLRHGQSVWNKENVFTGWVDIPLSEAGIEEAYAAGRKIRGMPIDVIYTSLLIRAHMTVALAMLQHESGRVPVFQGEWGEIYSDKMKAKTVPVYKARELNERMYGQLQGKNKAEMAEEFGAEQVQIWRRSYDVAPPEGESLAMTANRAVPYFKREILPRLKKGESVMICAHGNSQRAIVMHLDGLNQQQVVQLELATGEPRVYHFEGSRHERIDLPR